MFFVENHTRTGSKQKASTEKADSHVPAADREAVKAAF